MTRLIIVRHGNTFAPGDEPRRIGRRTDLPLVETGVAQARELGRYFAGMALWPRQILTAPLKRTTETAASIAAQLVAPPPIETAEWLAEIDHGPDEGTTERETIARIGPEALERWEAHGSPPPGWSVDAEARLTAWRRMLAAPDPGDTLLVTSNGAARFALLALPGAALPNRLKLRTGAFGIIARHDPCDATVAGWRVSEWDVRP